MRELMNEKKVVHIYSPLEKIVTDSYENADYIIAQVKNYDLAESDNLLQNGFSFHDRKLRVEINLAAVERNLKLLDRRESSYKLTVADTISEELFDLACAAFQNDRRFHLDHFFSSKLAEQIIEAYLVDFSKRNIMIFRAMFGEELLGFLIIEKHSDGICENILSATKPGIRGKSIAYGLYDDVINMLSKDEYGNFRKYYGDVSSTNLASINLHIRLGAKISDIYDEYIYRNVGRRHYKCCLHQ